MGFRCGICGAHTRRGEEIVLGTRPKEYVEVVMDERGVQSAIVVGKGHETVKAVRACEACIYGYEDHVGDDGAQDHWADISEEAA